MRYGEAMEKNQFTWTLEELDKYASLHFKDHASDIKKMIKAMADTIIDLPSKDHNKKANKIMIRVVWEKDIDLYVKRRET